MFRPEPLDLVLILLAAALLFGGSRLPETARAVGKAIHEFRQAVSAKEEQPAKEDHVEEVKQV